MWQVVISRRSASLLPSARSVCFSCIFFVWKGARPKLRTFRREGGRDNPAESEGYWNERRRLKLTMLLFCSRVLGVCRESVAGGGGSSPESS